MELMSTCDTQTHMRAHTAEVMSGNKIYYKISCVGYLTHAWCILINRKLRTFTSLRKPAGFSLILILSDALNS